MYASLEGSSSASIRSKSLRLASLCLPELTSAGARGSFFHEWGPTAYPKTRLVVSPLESVASSVLLVGPADRQIGARAEARRRRSRRP